jgi:hypothetical protein
MITEIHTDRDATILAIRTALKLRSGKAWSVKGGRGTAWGWIQIDAMPSQQTWAYRPRPGQGECPPPGDEHWEEYDTGKAGGHMSPADRDRLAELLGLDSVHFQGVSIPASHEYRREYIDRAEGRAPSVIAEPYWD